MDRDLLPHLAIVLAVARRGGFATAAAELRMSPSAVSHAVRAVEERLGQPLFARTTRSVALTEAGQLLLDGLRPAFDDIADRLERVRSRSGRASGLLRINASVIAMPLALAPVMAAMAELHPEVTIEVTADETLADIVSGGFDAGVRLGEMIAADMVAVRLTLPFRAIVVASLSYLGRYGRPTRPSDLAGHRCINYRMVGARALYAWELQEHERDVEVEVTGTATVTDALSARTLALQGLGLAYLFEPLVAADLAAGRLIEVLAPYAITEPGFFLYYPRRAALAPKLRAFVDTARSLGRG